MSEKYVWPDRLMIRDTTLHDDLGGLGQRIYTTAGAGYEKREYVRADLAAKPAADTIAKPQGSLDPNRQWEADLEDRMSNRDKASKEQSVRRAAELVMADGSLFLDYLKDAASRDTPMDEWTAGYEECKRRLLTILGPQLERLAVETSRDWQPIDTAPRDGREVLLKVALRAGIPGRCLVGHYMPGGHCVQDHPPIDAGWYFWTGHLFDRESKPVAWMPLPAESPVKTSGDSHE